MGCITYINELTNTSIHSCQMCDELPKEGDKMVINGTDYVITKVVPELTNGKKSVKVFIR